MIERVILHETLRLQIEEAAHAAFPRECCGLLEGASENGTVRVAAIHPARNLATDEDRFEIDPADQIRVMKQLRGTGRDIVGCYHSHPNGRAAPSPRDLEGAFGEGFLWVIVALKENENESKCPPPPRGEGYRFWHPTAYWERASPDAHRAERKRSARQDCGSAGIEPASPHAELEFRAPSASKYHQEGLPSPQGGGGRTAYDATLRAFELGSRSFREIAIIAAA